jgi:hypothetical protein
MPNTITRALTLAVFVSTFTDPSFAQAVRVPGTNVTLAPPEGFSLAKQYPGFERPEVQASIMVTELPGAAADMIHGMTKPTLAGKGVMLISASDAVINHKPARLLHVRQKTTRGEVLKWILITGDAEKTIMIVGTFTESVSVGIGDSIKQSLLTTSWGSSISSISSEGLPFRVTPTARLKLARRVSNMLMFTESGTIGAPGSTEALYIAGHSVGHGQIGDLRGFSESRATQTTLTTGVTNFMGHLIQADGLDAYELEADAADARSGSAMRLYQVIVPDETGYFILQGLSGADRSGEIFQASPLLSLMALTSRPHRVADGGRRRARYTCWR